MPYRQKYLFERRLLVPCICANSASQLKQPRPEILRKTFLALGRKRHVVHFERCVHAPPTTFFSRKNAAFSLASLLYDWAKASQLMYSRGSLNFFDTRNPDQLFAIDVSRVFISSSSSTRCCETDVGRHIMSDGRWPL